MKRTLAETDIAYVNTALYFALVASDRKDGQRPVMSVVMDALDDYGCMVIPIHLIDEYHRRIKELEDQLAGPGESA